MLTIQQLNTKQTGGGGSLENAASLAKKYGIGESTIKRLLKTGSVVNPSKQKEIDSAELIFF